MSRCCSHRRTGCLTRSCRAIAFAAARMLVARGVDQVILADDGLQHLRLARDCEIVVIDGRADFGNGRLLPAGPLREPRIARARQADALVVNGAREHRIPLRGVRAGAGRDGCCGCRSVAAERVQAGRLGADPLPHLEAFRGHRCTRSPESAIRSVFSADLRACGMEIIEHPFPDHHAFSAADLDFADGLPVLMTEKDAVKCRAFAGPTAVVRAGRGAPSARPTRVSCSSA